jgi:hypothetical protein
MEPRIVPKDQLLPFGMVGHEFGDEFPGFSTLFGE